MAVIGRRNDEWRPEFRLGEFGVRGYARRSTYVEAEFPTRKMLVRLTRTHSLGGVVVRLGLSALACWRRRFPTRSGRAFHRSLPDRRRPCPGHRFMCIPKWRRSTSIRTATFTTTSAAIRNRIRNDRSMSMALNGKSSRKWPAFRQPVRGSDELFCSSGQPYRYRDTRLRRQPLRSRTLPQGDR